MKRFLILIATLIISTHLYGEKNYSLTGIGPQVEFGKNGSQIESVVEGLRVLDKDGNLGEIITKNPLSGVQSFAGVAGIITTTSSDGSVTITPDVGNHTIDFKAKGGGDGNVTDVSTNHAKDEIVIFNADSPEHNINSSKVKITDLAKTAELPVKSLIGGDKINVADNEGNWTISYQEDVDIDQPLRNQVGLMVDGDVANWNTAPPISLKGAKEGLEGKLGKTEQAADSLLLGGKQEANLSVLQATSATSSATALTADKITTDGNDKQIWGMSGTDQGWIEGGSYNDTPIKNQIGLAIDGDIAHWDTAPPITLQGAKDGLDGKLGKTEQAADSLLLGGKQEANLSVASSATADDASALNGKQEANLAVLTATKLAVSGNDKQIWGMSGTDQGWIEGGSYNDTPIKNQIGLMVDGDIAHWNSPPTDSINNLKITKQDVLKASKADQVAVFGTEGFTKYIDIPSGGGAKDTDVEITSEDILTDLECTNQEEFNQAVYDKLFAGNGLLTKDIWNDTDLPGINLKKILNSFEDAFSENTSTVKSAKTVKDALTKLNDKITSLQVEVTRMRDAIDTYSKGDK